VLEALRDAGIGIREDDLIDRRRGGPGGPRKRRLEEHPVRGDGASAPGSSPEGQLVEILKRAREVLATGHALQSGAKVVIHVDAPAPETMFRAQPGPQRPEKAREIQGEKNLWKSRALSAGPKRHDSIERSMEHDDE
jgi:hypothetical protein